MTITSLVVLQLSCLVAAASDADKLKSVTPDAIAEARRVLDYLKRIYNHELVVTWDEGNSV